MGQRWKAEILGLLAVGLMSPLPVLAAIINYDEAIGGDLSSFSHSVATTFVLGVGVNSVQGTVLHNFTTSTFDYDGFAFVVVPGTTLNQIDIYGSDGSPGNMVYLRWGVATGTSGPGTVLDMVDVFSPGSYSYINQLGPGTYRLYMNGSAFIGNLSAGNWQTLLTVSSVPEPDTAWLLLSGLAGLGVMRRRQLNRATASSALGVAT